MNDKPHVIMVTDYAYGLIVDLCDDLDQLEATRTEQGSWLVPLSSETMALLTSARLEGESWSDVVVRVISKQKGLN